MQKSTPSELARMTLEFSRTLRRYMHTCENVDKVNFLQIHALLVIEEHDGITMKEFAEHMKITSPSATSFVDRLAKLKWVRRRTSTKNRKVIRLALTASGKKYLTEKKKEHARGMERIFQLIPPEDQVHLQRILTNLITQLHHS